MKTTVTIRPRFGTEMKMEFDFWGQIGVENKAQAVAKELSQSFGVKWTVKQMLQPLEIDEGKAWHGAILEGGLHNVGDVRIVWEQNK